MLTGVRSCSARTTLFHSPSSSCVWCASSLRTNQRPVAKGDAVAEVAHLELRGRWARAEHGPHCVWLFVSVAIVALV